MTLHEAKTLLTENHLVFETSEFEKAIQRIQAPKGFIPKVLKTNKQYEI